MKQLCILIFKLSAIVLFMNGCGGGGESNTQTPITRDYIVVDGYIDEAILKDSNGHIATSKGKGVYQFTNDTYGNITATGGKFVDSGVPNLATFIVDKDQVVISPITSFLKTYPNLESSLANALNIEPLELYEDFIANNNLNAAKLAQILYTMQIHNLLDDYAKSINNPNSIGSLIDLAKSISSSHEKSSEIEVFLSSVSASNSINLESELKNQKQQMQSLPKDDTAPILADSIPKNNTTNVSTHLPYITLIFSEEIYNINQKSVQLMLNDTLVPTKFEHDKNIVKIIPSDKLQGASSYKIILSDALTDLSGNLFKSIRVPQECTLLEDGRLECIEIEFSTKINSTELPKPTPNNQETSPYWMLKTGQTKSYYKNDDGDLEHGIARNYTDNFDGTITDNTTSLVWQRANNSVKNLEDAKNHCATLNFAGYSDWRLPSYVELMSLVDYGRAEPAINPLFNLKDGVYLTSTINTTVFTQPYIQGVDFYVGGAAYLVMDGQFSYICVHEKKGE